MIYDQIFMDKNGQFRFLYLFFLQYVGYVFWNVPGLLVVEVYFCKLHVHVEK